MKDLRDTLIAAVLRRQALLDAMAALRRQWRPCERTLHLEEDERKPCWKDDRPGLEIEYFDGFRWAPFKRGSPEYAEHIRENWCPACRANEPLVAEYYRLRRSKGGLASTVAQLARRVAAQRQAESKSCPMCHEHEDE